MPHLGFWVPAVLLLIRTVVIDFFRNDGSLDLAFFTYLNLTFVAFAMTLLLISMTNRAAFAVATTLLLPLIFGTTVFVMFAIVVIIQLNDGVFLKTTVYNGGERSVGTVQTGNWLIHYWTVVELLFYIWLTKRESVTAFHYVWRELGRFGRVAYVFYFMLVALGALIIYMLQVDFTVNYPTDVSVAATTGLTIGLSLLIQAFWLVLLRYSRPDGHLSTPLLQGIET